MNQHKHLDHDPKSHDMNHSKPQPHTSAPVEDHTHHHQSPPENHEKQMRHNGHDDHQGNHVNHSGHERMFRKRFWISLILSIPVLLFSPSIQSWFQFTMPTFWGSGWITIAFSLIVFIYGGLPFLKMALPELKNSKPGMMTLISLAISVAFIYSLAAFFFQLGNTFFWELVTLIDIMLLGHWLEMRSVRQASGALDELTRLMPDTAEKILPDGAIREVPQSELKTGDLFLVRPGTSVPADGQVEQGESELNEAMITGESQPVTKGKGDTVIAGTLNGDGSLRVRVTATGEDTALAGIMRLVEQAQESKSRTQILADKAAGWLFYVALGTAVITAIAWSIAVGFNVEVIARVATVLVIACPHALGLAVPLIVAITTAIGAKHGILIRDRLALEQARMIDTVIFDKTGTLTKGEFGVANISVIDGWSKTEALGLTAAIEGDSEHTIARGFRESAGEQNLSLPEVSQFEAIQGRGIKAFHQDAAYHVGGPRMLEYLNASIPESLLPLKQQAEDHGQSIVYLMKENQPVAAFTLADIIRPESKPTINQLHQMGIRIAMLTGDSRAVAEAVAQELGIDQVYAEVLPEHKNQIISDLQTEGRTVAMVGDGVNDAPALTTADVGIAIGGGTDVAIESAGIILVRSNPLDVVKIFSLSKASYKKMIQNLWWATGYNLIALPLAAGVLAPIGFVLSPAVGAVLMSLSTVIVAVNAQLLRKVQFSRESTPSNH